MRVQTVFRELCDLGIASNILDSRRTRLVSAGLLIREEGAPRALLFGSGYLANLAVMQALLEEEDVCVQDRLNHACLIDGARLAKSPRKVYPHKDMKALRAILESPECRKARRRMIVTDGVFSMDGDLAPLPEIMDLADRFEAERERVQAVAQREQDKTETDRQMAELREDLAKLRAAAADPQTGETVRAALAYNILRDLYADAWKEVPGKFEKYFDPAPGKGE